MRNQFFIGGEENDRKTTWVKWRQCLAPKDVGGLGVGSIYALNVALLYKWVWRYKCNANELWCTVISAIHGDKGGLDEDVRNRLHYSPWCAIIKGIRDLARKGVNLFDKCVKRVGNGNATKFWHDKWCGDHTFASKFDRVFALDRNKNDTVAKVIQRSSNGEWSQVLRRNPRGGIEAIQFNQMIAEIQSFGFSDQDDVWSGSLHADGYTVNLARRYIDETLLPSLPISTQWNKWVPLKINVFVWRLRLNRLPTLVNVDKKGIEVNSTLCMVCGDPQETVNNIFFSCALAKDLWGNLARWLHLDIQVCDTYVEFSTWVLSISCSKKVKMLIEAITGAMLWAIWRFRNGMVFAKDKPKKMRIWDMLVFSTFNWISSRNPKLKCSWLDWVDNPIVNSKFM